LDLKVWADQNPDFGENQGFAKEAESYIAQAVAFEEKLKELSQPRFGRNDFFLEGVGYLDFLHLKQRVLTENAFACRHTGYLARVFLPWILEFAREKNEQQVSQKIADYKGVVETHFSRVSEAERRGYLQKAQLKNAFPHGSQESSVFDEAGEVAAACESSESLATRWGLHAWKEAMCCYRLACNEAAACSAAELQAKCCQAKEQLLKKCKRKVFDWADKIEERLEERLQQGPQCNPAGSECALVKSCCEKQLIELNRSGKGVDNVFKHDVCKNSVEYCVDDKAYENNRRGRPLISHQNWYRFVRTQVNLGAIHAILGDNQNGSVGKADNPSLRSRLLRILEENEFECGFLKLGSLQPEHYDFSEYRPYGFGHISAKEMLADNQKVGMDDQIWRKIQRHKVFLKSEYILSLLPRADVLKFLKGRIFVCLREWAHLLITAQSCPHTAGSVHLIRAAIAGLIGYYDYLDKANSGAKVNESWTQTRCGDRSVSHLDGQPRLGLPHSYVFHKAGEGVADEAYFLPFLSPQVAEETLNKRWLLGIVIPRWEPEIFKFRFQKALSNNSGRTDAEFLRLLRLAMNTLNQ
jgi:hypothetical protein